MTGLYMNRALVVNSLRTLTRIIYVKKNHLGVLEECQTKTNVFSTLVVWLNTVLYLLQ